MYSYSVFFPLNIYLEMVLLDHRIVPLLTFWRNSILFQNGYTSLFPTNSAEVFPFVYTFLNTVDYSVLFFVFVFGKMSILLPIFKSIVDLIFCYWVVWVLYVFWILTPNKIYYLKIMFPFCRMYFHFVVYFFFCIEVF